MDGDHKDTPFEPSSFDVPRSRHVDSFPAMRYLGVDLGRVRIGLALADDIVGAARPLSTVHHVNSEEDLARIVEIAREWEVGRVVVGLPLNMDGSEGPGARHARTFAERLGQALGMPVLVHDERLSTFEAEGRLRERGVSSRSIREKVDSEAAAVILQEFLDHHSPDRPGDSKE